MNRKYGGETVGRLFKAVVLSLLCLIAAILVGVVIGVSQAFGGYHADLDVLEGLLVAGVIFPVPLVLIWNAIDWLRARMAAKSISKQNPK